MYKRVQHPELYILHIGRFKIGIIYGPGYTTPSRLRVGEGTVLVDVGCIKIIWPPVSRIKSNIKCALHRLQSSCTLVRKNILRLNNPYILKVTGVLAHVSWQTIAGVHQRRFYGVPIHTAPVIAILEIIFQRSLREKGLAQPVNGAKWRGRKRPGYRREFEIIAAARTFKVINIHCSLGVQRIYLLRMAGQQRRYFQVTVQEGWRGSGVYRQLVQRTGKSRHFCLVVSIHTDHSILDRVFAIRYLLRERALIQAHDGTTQCKVLIHIVIETGGHEILLLKTERGIILILYVDGYTRVKDTRIDDLQFAQAIVHSIVLVLHQLGTARRHTYRPRRDIEAPQKYVGG